MREKEEGLEVEVGEKGKSGEDRGIGIGINKWRKKEKKRVNGEIGMNKWGNYFRTILEEVRRVKRGTREERDRDTGRGSWGETSWIK